MSRGMGRVQREILAHLGTLHRDEFGHWSGTTVWKLAKAVFPTDEHEPTAAQLESVRRAVRSLLAAERVVTWRPEWQHHSKRRTYRQRVHYHRAFDYWGKPLEWAGSDSWERTVGLSERLVSLAPDPSPEEAAAWQEEKKRQDERMERFVQRLKA